MPSQVQLFYKEQRNIAEANQVFLDLVHGGLTREELERCIQRRPKLWSRFSGYLGLLPSARSLPDTNRQPTVISLNPIHGALHELTH